MIHNKRDFIAATTTLFSSPARQSLNQQKRSKFSSGASSSSVVVAPPFLQRNLFISQLSHLQRLIKVSCNQEWWVGE